MSYVIYTGAFSIGWNYFDGLQQWQIYNLYNMQKYCDRHDIELRVIDNSNKELSSLFSYAREKSNYKADSWNIATLSSIIALNDFSKRNDDKFLWLDLDFVITDHKLDIFKYIDEYHILIELWYKTIFNEKKEKFFSYLNRYLPQNAQYIFPLLCYSGIFGCDTIRAKGIIDFMHSHSVYPTYSFIDDMIELYKGDKHFISDECIMEFVCNNYAGSEGNGRINVPVNIKDYINIELVTEDNMDSVNAISDDFFGYHFASGSKINIPKFFRDNKLC
jgi:hypothetical protein